MNESEVTQQVQQMVRFIKQEADEKSNEIGVAAEEEFNIEKLQIVEAEKRKIKGEYERKEKQVAIANKIGYSKQLNASRLKVLQAQDELVKKMKEEAETELLRISSDSSSDDYKDLLRDLIAQGLFRLKETEVRLRCREVDLDAVKEVLENAIQVYINKTALHPPSIDVDESIFLQPAPKCAGGVVLATKDGKIVCCNTLDARLEIAFKQNLPAIRESMFKTAIVT
eukprot:TRINITY_DN1847_c0_g1_i1.p1 TRINITY_DN1847_c0_g1~~TRINITY_DN1847_c0_g1_i1.p1  ORF type:complete len:248 (+),score=69.05 TRINITY_DN1847_c0_g1_i1:67-744(+)